MMKLLVIIISFMSIFSRCQNATKKIQVIQNTTEIQKPVKDELVSTKENFKEKKIPVDTSTKIKPAYILALTSNALMLDNSKTGSTTEIAFGKPLEQMVETINKVLPSKVASIGLNSECGAGPLKNSSLEKRFECNFQGTKIKC
jgi:hypothetical protein